MEKRIEDLVSKDTRVGAALAQVMALARDDNYRSMCGILDEVADIRRRIKRPTEDHAGRRFVLKTLDILENKIVDDVGKQMADALARLLTDDAAAKRNVN